MKFPRFLFLSAFALSGVASATVVNIDFKHTSLVAYQGLAAAPDVAGATAHWNALQNVSGTASSVDLNDSFNFSSGIGFTLQVDSSVNNATGAQELQGGYSTLMKDYVRIESTAGVVETKTGQFTGLVVGFTYDIYFYGQGENFGGGSSSLQGQNSLFRIDGVEKRTSWDTVATGNGLLVENIEYVKFSWVATGTTLDFEWENVIAAVNGPDPDGILTGSRIAGLNGIQIVETVPEPSSALLGALGVLSLIARRRR